MKLETMEKLIKMANPSVRALLRSPLHGLVSRDIVLFTHYGRKSGKPYPTPLSYVEDGQTLRLCTSREGWWKNVAAKPDVDVVLRGKKRRGHATTIADDPDRIAAGIESILEQVPRDAAFYQVRMEDGRPNADDLRRAAEQAVLIEVQLS